jgi:hypothetical protein
MNSKVVSVISSVFLMGSVSMAGGLLNLKSSVERQSMVELFSSEGCSSCPPAEKWLGALRHDPGLWTKFIPIEFHVNYWDGLGWKDPYANGTFTQRQRDYAELWKIESVYTPGVALNGNEWLGWRSAGTAELTKAGEPVGILEVKELSKRKFFVKFMPATKSSDSEYFINAALLENRLISQVSRGENSGSDLHHDFVAVSLKTNPLKSKNGAFEGEIDLSETDFKTKPSSLSGAFWVSGKNPKPIQAVGGDLSL